mgnify:CR=1 FL=1
MAKPIFIIRHPERLSMNEHSSLQSLGEEKLPDYHVIVVSSDVKELQFECYNADKLPDADIEKLKELCNLTTAKP